MKKKQFSIGGIILVAAFIAVCASYVHLSYEGIEAQVKAANEMEAVKSQLAQTQRTLWRTRRELAATAKELEQAKQKIPIVDCSSP